MKNLKKVFYSALCVITAISMCPTAALAEGSSSGDNPAADYQVAESETQGSVDQGNEFFVDYDMHLIQGGDCFSVNDSTENGGGNYSAMGSTASDFTDEQISELKSAVASGIENSSPNENNEIVIDISDIGLLTDQSSYHDTGEKVSDCAREVIDGNPDYFYFDSNIKVGFITYPKYAVESITLTYSYTTDQVATMKAEYETAMADLLSWVPQNSSNALKVKAVHDWLVRNCAYNTTAASQGKDTYGPEPWTAYGALVKKQPVCEGYTLAFVAAMNRLGFETSTVSQTVNSTGHIWNRVKIDGNWYNIDVTFDDPLLNGTTDQGFDNTPETTYFLKSDSWFISNPCDGYHTVQPPAGSEGTDTQYDNKTDWQTFSGPSSSATVTSFSLDKSSITMGRYGADSLSISTITPSSASKANAKWSSSNNAIASVSPSGVVYGGSTVGTATITCKIGSVSRTCTVTVQPTELQQDYTTFWFDYKGETISYPYTGYDKKPLKLLVYYGAKELTLGTDYTLTYPDDIKNAGDKTITVTGMGNYTGTVFGTYTISPLSLTEDTTVSCSPTSSEYTGSEVKPKVSVKRGYRSLKEGTDFTVSYSNNVNVGTATATVTGMGNYADTASTTFEVTQASLSSGAEVSFSPTSAEYTGSAISAPSVTVKKGGRTLVEGTDYTVSWPTDMTSAGAKAATVTGKGNYKDSTSATFTVNPASLSAGTTVTVSPTSAEYTGSAISAPSVTVKKGGKTLAEGTDYTVAWPSDMTNAGKKTVTVQGKGNYKDSATATFTVSQKSISGATVTLDPTKIEFTGSQVIPGVKVVVAGKTLKEGTDYSVDFSGNVNVGTATATVKGKGNYKDSASATFTISPASLTTGTTVTVSPTSSEYTGSAVAKPSVKVVKGGRTLVEGTDYTVSWPTDMTSAGAKAATVTGKGNYAGSASATFTVKPASLATGTTVTLSPSSAEYTGSAIAKPSVKVTKGGKTLVEGTDYTLSWPSDMTKVGAKSVTINGKGNYKDSATATFTIKPASISGAQVSLSQDSFVYSASEARPKASVSISGKSLVEGTDFTVSYSNNVNAGTATVTVTGKGNYSGTSSATFTIAKAPFTVAARDAAKTPGDPDPQLSCTVSGLKGNDELAGCDVSREPGEEIGTYVITPSGARIANASGADVTPNYEISYVEGKLTIASDFPWTRIGGASRYETSAMISEDGFDTSDAVVIAYGGNFPDALAASGIAGTLDAPVILTEKESLSEEAAAEVSRLGAKEAYVVGGRGAVSDRVVSDLKGMGLNVTRIAGADRFETARMIYSAGEGWGDTAIVASGTSFADALSVSPLAYAERLPIFLVGSDGKLDQATASMIRSDFKHVILVGGSARVSGSVTSQLGEGVECERLSGGDRYQTSAVIADYSVANSDSISYDGMLVATGMNFPDALSGGALAGRRGTVLMLVDSATKRSSAGEYCINNVVKKNASKISTGTFLGGTGAVSGKLAAKVEGASK
ncbi:MAG: cell wall-binding repeat-containing protein [Coriobacteriales bacterium]|jgi:putative cell wall-binding protein